MYKKWERFVRAWTDYPLQEGTLIGQRYRVIAQIGVGSYGITYYCLDEREQRKVAVKQAKPSKKRIGQILLAREREIIAKLDHPFIPTYRDYIQEGRSLWLVTDYVKGQTLEDMIFGEGRIFRERDTVEWTLQLMDRVQHVHHKGFVHLDLRIPNIVISEGNLYLIDFGLAQPIGDGPPVKQILKQTVTHSLTSRKPANIQSDLFDIGHLMLFMLYSSFTPESGVMERHWSEELKLSKQLRLILRRLFGEDEPYQHCSDFVADLHGSLAWLES
ncbi:serine/threonine protein kinase [Paenibacillus caui]|uniref:serine/threonine protein kinase n=1 Tax=Paenibacillus caui TaxID=2873927 RepID=UPI001CA8F705|nr:protein kinase [Paenibacillus caui]